jgi:hypothetical protein
MSADLCTLNLRNITSEIVKVRGHVCIFWRIMFMYVIFSAPNSTCLVPGIIICGQETEINSRFVSFFHMAAKLLDNIFNKDFI